MRCSAYVDIATVTLDIVVPLAIDEGIFLLL
jgi:hypothetical protein